MLKDLAEALEEKFDGEIPTSYDDLLQLPGIDDRAAILYMNYSAERSEVSLLVACVKFPSGSEYWPTISTCNSICQWTATL